jgi:hypothetical protein
MSSPNKQQQRTVKPITQIAAQLRASFASRCAGRYGYMEYRVMKKIFIGYVPINCC